MYIKFIFKFEPICEYTHAINHWSCKLFYFPKNFPIHCILQYLPHLSNYYARDSLVSQDTQIFYALVLKQKIQEVSVLKRHSNFLGTLLIKPRRQEQEGQVVSLLARSNR